MTSEETKLLAFDAAASVPATAAVMSAVSSAMGAYGSVHRGFGPRSLASSDLYERARRTVASHFGVPETHCVVFTSNTTDAIVKLARALKPRTVANSIFEHSANDLPWRQAGHEVRGYEHFAGIRGDLIAWSGASNITGAITELSDMYQHIKGRGAPLFVDASQRVAHAQTLIGVHCDALAFSGHKIGAPFGAGALICPKEWLRTNPLCLGGGSVVYYDEEGSTVEKEPPHNWESGTPNLVGAVAMAAALKELDYDAIKEHDDCVEFWYRKHLVPVVGEYYWCNGSTLMLPIRKNIVEAFRGKVEARCGAFCCYQAFRDLLGEPKTTNPSPEDWGGLRLSAHPSVTEEDVKAVAEILTGVR